MGFIEVIFITRRKKLKTKDFKIFPKTANGPGLENKVL